MITGTAGFRTGLLLAALAMTFTPMISCEKDTLGPRPDQGYEPISDVPIILLPDSGPRDVPGDSAGLPDSSDPGQEPDGFVPDDKGPGTDIEGDSDVIEDDVGCRPKCDGRECGPDGCGGTCGTCPPDREFCDPMSGKCLCVPACSGKVCGDDGCGAACPPGCSGAQQCSPDGRKCWKSGPCENTQIFKCSDISKSSTTAFSQIGNTLTLYSQECSTEPVLGQEKVYKFVADGTGTVTLDIAGTTGAGSLRDFLALYLIEGSVCDASFCTMMTRTSLSFQATEGQVFWFAVDANKQDTGGFVLSIDCPWYTPPAT